MLLRGVHNCSWFFTNVYLHDQKSVLLFLFDSVDKHFFDQFEECRFHFIFDGAFSDLTKIYKRIFNHFFKFLTPCNSGSLIC